MNKFAAILGAIALTLSAGSALAQSGDVNIPGIGKAKGSAGSTIKNSTINVTGNKSGSVLAIGGEVDAKIAGARMSGVANVNSVNITGSTVEGSGINVAVDLHAFGFKACDHFFFLGLHQPALKVDGGLRRLGDGGLLFGGQPVELGLVHGQTQCRIGVLG